MTLGFIKQINEYIIDATLKDSDEEILASVGRSGYPSQQEVKQAHTAIIQAIGEQRKHQLSQQKSAFEEYKRNKKVTQFSSHKKPISEMLSDIISTLQSQDKIPEGIILAFREQSKGGSEEDIAEIWQNLVELGLIDSGEIEK